MWITVLSLSAPDIILHKYSLLNFPWYDAVSMAVSMQFSTLFDGVILVVITSHSFVPFWSSSTVEDTLYCWWARPQAYPGVSLRSAFISSVVLFQVWWARGSLGKIFFLIFRRNIGLLFRTFFSFFSVWKWHTLIHNACNCTIWNPQSQQIC